MRTDGWEDGAPVRRRYIRSMVDVRAVLSSYVAYGLSVRSRFGAVEECSPSGVCSLAVALLSFHFPAYSFR